MNALGSAPVRKRGGTQNPVRGTPRPLVQKEKELGVTELRHPTSSQEHAEAVAVSAIWRVRDDYLLADGQLVVGQPDPQHDTIDRPFSSPT